MQAQLESELIKLTSTRPGLLSVPAAAATLGAYGAAVLLAAQVALVRRDL